MLSPSSSDPLSLVLPAPVRLTLAWSRVHNVPSESCTLLICQLDLRTLLFDKFPGFGTDSRSLRAPLSRIHLRRLLDSLWRYVPNIK